MNADLYKQSIDYEKLTQMVYQLLLEQEGVITIQVEHNVTVMGRSGVEHQIDVMWRFKQAGIAHAVLIECKNYGSALTLEKVRNFFAVLHDIGDARGLMVTKIGYQDGARRFAEHYGIGLKILRSPSDADWKGRIRDIHLRMTAKVPVSTPERPISLEFELEEAEHANIQTVVALLTDWLTPERTPNLCWVNAEGIPISERLADWLPQQLSVLDRPEGGPYEQRIPLRDYYLAPDCAADPLRIAAVRVCYWVEIIAMDEIVMHGMEIVEAILKDDCTGEIEFVKRR